MKHSVVLDHNHGLVTPKKSHMLRMQQSTLRCSPSHDQPNADIWNKVI
jgi:hypothetical protein